MTKTLFELEGVLIFQRPVKVSEDIDAEKQYAAFIQGSGRPLPLPPTYSKGRRKKPQTSLRGEKD